MRTAAERRLLVSFVILAKNAKRGTRNYAAPRLGSNHTQDKKFSNLPTAKIRTNV
jgi:hypothetical protein